MGDRHRTRTSVRWGRAGQGFGCGRACPRDDDIRQRTYGAIARLIGRSYTAAMWPLVLWLAILAAAGLCYPRRPRTAGVLFIGLGVLSLVMGFLASPGNWLAPAGGVFLIGLGMSYIVKYRRPELRAKHVEYWTAKS